MNLVLWGQRYNFFMKCACFFVLLSFYIFFRNKRDYVFWKFCTFATDSSFPKRITFRNQKTKKFPKTDNFDLLKGHKH